MSETYLAKGRPIYAMRLGTPERRLLEAAAAMYDVSLAEYIRRIALQAARRELLGTDAEAVEPAA